ncbi:ISSod13 transposase [Nephila pilipes]|uniref:ISSod13 transposase n=1 Tax=Nephila pilipes TaxID=299642 RepID=A0A8X6PX26_NEPPI|nr:ISSod13 transposase [Nephila pilipes]
MEKRATSLFEIIRCPICSGESLSESGSQIAYDMREAIRKKINDGYTDEEIISELKNSYGNSIITIPPSTYILWFIPLTTLLVGCFLIRNVWIRKVATNELKREEFLCKWNKISVAKKNDLEKKRGKALEAKKELKMAFLTEEQINNSSREGKEEKEAHGEIETEHPGYLGSQDSYYVGNIKGIGRIYQQTFVDTYSRVAFAKLYTERTAITAADLLNDRVIPFFDEQKVSLLRILTDRGTEYCGRPENHAYQLYLGVENIDHSRTKAVHKLMAYVKGSTELCKMNATILSSERKFTPLWQNFS